MSEVTTITIQQEKESGILSKITCENCIQDKLDIDVCEDCLRLIVDMVVDNDPQCHIFNPDTELSDEEREVITKEVRTK